MARRFNHLIIKFCMTIGISRYIKGNESFRVYDNAHTYRQRSDENQGTYDFGALQRVNHGYTTR